MYRIGLDIGSTTMKVVLLSPSGEIIYKCYERHYSEIVKKSIEMLERVKSIVGKGQVEVAFSGSAGMGIADKSDIPFIQEVYATRLSAKEYLPETDVIIELGGEDAKILFLTNGLEVRMNGTCAGGTGAFIDQMATLLGVEKEEIGPLAEKSTELYTIASRCGVFAKSDIQPLINQGAKKEDIAASILMAVVNQTISGLAQGRKIEGNVVYLGGPLSFIPKLREYFDSTLKTKGICPENSLYYVALGAALNKEKKVTTIDGIIDKISSYKNKATFNSLPPLFKNEEEYKAFCSRHEKDKVKREDIAFYKGDVYLGLDAGSTTIKAVFITPNGSILDEFYSPNNGNPVALIRFYLLSFYEKYPYLTIKGAAVTGYGEELLKTALELDYSLVETQAHFIAARFFLPSVDFIIDIGGQDIKCFKIEDGAIDDIFLNEACSSGCGSFLQTFANALGLSSQEFASKAIYAKHPVDLGSRCTVFMNSSVKQAQKDGASTEDISAGLAISVVKNALYKVIRTSSKEAIGSNIVVQGGTFLNDGVLRAFELELGKDVIRPTIAGLMGAYGAALYAKKESEKEEKTKSSIIDKDKLQNLKHEVKNVRCQGCTNHCLLTINSFSSSRRLISGNKCERPISGKANESDKYNIYQYKQELLEEYIEKRGEGERGTIGLPLALGMYETLPFFHTLFSSLGFKVITSPFSNREQYLSGQSSIPSDTVCFPAKLMHGSVEYLKKEGVDKIFIPCSSYNIDEGCSDNHFNCPVVAYYAEVIRANWDPGKSQLITPYLSLEKPKHFASRISSVFSISEKEVLKATKKAEEEERRYKEKILNKAKEIIKTAREEKRPIIMLSGRPYHLDKETNHSIDRLIVSLGCSVLSEDSIPLEGKEDLRILNQWTFHSRLYNAAYFVSKTDDINLVQLVSFGCGLDAVTTDEVKEILRRNNKIYTQLKIDEITNVGAVKIRLRSLLAALKEREV